MTNFITMKPKPKLRKEDQTGMTKGKKPEQSTNPNNVALNSEDEQLETQTVVDSEFQSSNQASSKRRRTSRKGQKGNASEHIDDDISADEMNHIDKLFG